MSYGCTRWRPSADLDRRRGLRFVARPVTAADQQGGHFLGPFVSSRRMSVSGSPVKGPRSPSHWLTATFAFGLPRHCVSPGPARRARQFRENTNPNRCYSAPAGKPRTAINEQSGGRDPHVSGPIQHELFVGPAGWPNRSNGTVPDPCRGYVVRAVRSGSHILRECTQ